MINLGFFLFKLEFRNVFHIAKFNASNKGVTVEKYIKFVKKKTFLYFYICT